jgi:Protein of unknown function (DUF3467)
METPEQQQFQFTVPDEVAPGVYSNMVLVWHTPYEFTLDFSAIEPSDANRVPCRVVSRVRIPPTVIFDLMRALNENMAKYEASFGEIKRLGGGGPQAPSGPEPAGSP